MSHLWRPEREPPSSDRRVYFTEMRRITVRTVCRAVWSGRYSIPSINSAHSIVASMTRTDHNDAGAAGIEE
jgi:hypothetical protein